MNGLIGFIVLSMIFCHIIADYNLQGWLATAKQKVWWQTNASSERYKYDYIMALLMHSFGWTFLVMLPIALYFNFIITPMFIVMFLINIVLHAYIDNLKANRYCINLVVDQILHLVQIAATALLVL